MPRFFQMNRLLANAGKLITGASALITAATIYQLSSETDLSDELRINLYNRIYNSLKFGVCGVAWMFSQDKALVVNLAVITLAPTELFTQEHYTMK